MVPMINTAEEARYVLSSSKFPPLGVRGQGSPFTASAFGITTPEYIRCANDNLLTIVQIETRQAVENIEDIVQVPGIGEKP
jgi:4-hydroxy-2-oxoheptanedioate aldolase